MSRLRWTASFGPLALVCLLACICLLAAGTVPSLGASPAPSPATSASASAEPRYEPSPWHSPTLGQTPSPTAVSPDLLEPVDARSEGSGPGLVGSPLTILLGVIVLGILSALVTAAWVRLTRQG